MKKIVMALIVALLAGCAGILPEKSPTKLEKSPCACGQADTYHV